MTHAEQVLNEIAETACRRRGMLVEGIEAIEFRSDAGFLYIYHRDAHSGCIVADGNGEWTDDARREEFERAAQVTANLIESGDLRFNED